MSKNLTATQVLERARLFCSKLWNLTEGQEGTFASVADLAKVTGLNESDINQIGRFLESRGFLQKQAAFFAFTGAGLDLHNSGGICQRLEEQGNLE